MDYGMRIFIIGQSSFTYYQKLKIVLSSFLTKNINGFNSIDDEYGAGVLYFLWGVGVHILFISLSSTDFS
jgi:hypothetical protein